jgi:thiamine-monophosphate kinase
MTTIGGLGETELLRRILPFLATSGYEVVAGADDVAVWRSHDVDHPADYVVATCDTSVEGVHFDFSWMNAEDVGHRALALALGDLAAKGAKPRFALVALSAPRSWPVARVVGIYQGMHRLAVRLDLKIAGGDTTSIDGPAVLTLTLIGESPVVPLARDSVQPGWVVAVTGPLGASAVALRERRSLLIEPKLDDGSALNLQQLCCGDVSDGLVREMEKFAAASGAGCTIRAPEVPVAPGATTEDALTSGEEVELVCVGPEDKVLRAGLRPFGVMTDDPEIRVLGADGSPFRLKASGYDHFA